MLIKYLKFIIFPSYLKELTLKSKQNSAKTRKSIASIETVHI